MSRKALLIGLNVYSFIESKQADSPALQNLEALQQVLLSNIGQFEEADIETLINPDAQQIRQAIERFSSHCRPRDLRLLYFCGLGLIDPHTHRFYLAGYDTQPQNLLNTAISDEFMRGLLSRSHSRRQVVLLDTCWGQPEVTPAAGIPTSQAHWLMAPLAGEHRAVLVAQNAAEGWSLADSGLSEYTHSLIEGIETGLADMGADGMISIDDLHQYLEQNLERLSLRTQALLHAPGESSEIQLFHLSQYVPETEYRRSVEEYVTKDQGAITDQSRQVLDFLRTHLGISPEVSQAIEADVLRPYQERQERLNRYEQVFTEAIQLENPPRKSIRRWLRHLQQTLSLTYADVTPIEARILADHTLPFSRPTPRLEPLRSEVSPVRLASVESDRNATAG